MVVLIVFVLLLLWWMLAHASFILSLLLPLMPLAVDARAVVFGVVYGPYR